MPGKRITEQQIRLYMKLINEGKTQRVASAKAGLSERTGRRISTGELIIAKSPHYWRTRQDPLEDVWDSQLVPLLEKTPDLLPLTLFEWLGDNYPGIYPASIKRTLQRRIKQWKAIHGPAKEVMFRQQKIPGQLGLSDFTHLKKARITIEGEEFKHILYHYRLAFSGWSYMKVILGGESFAALSTGLQTALWLSGGSPKEHRTDSLSAAYTNQSEKEKLTERYELLCKHYHLKGTRNTPGKSHENGAIESPHGHIKRRIEQALLLRGSSDFKSIDEYQKFIEQVVQKKNRGCQALLKEERQHLTPLPKQRTHDYVEHYVRVTSSSTIVVRRVTYTVPSRLIGEKLCVHLFDDRLELYCGHVHVETFDRVYAKGRYRKRSVNYRHVIHSLARKPQAFRFSQIRDDLLPNQDYKEIWQHVDDNLETRKASGYMVKILVIAANHDCEGMLGRYVLNQWKQHHRLPSIEQCQKRFITQTLEQVPLVSTKQHALIDYNQLLQSLKGETAYE